jgi:polysaccharide pyruvyl transferase WcaK-like protein
MNSLPVVLFGAFDRHNFGDMLFPHVVARMLGGREVSIAGLAERDMRAMGGHRVRAITKMNERAFDVIHVGGEILTCDAWSAAVMLQTPQAAQRVIALQHGDAGWVRSVLGLAALAPYTVSTQWLPSAARAFYNAVGGVGLNDRDAAMRAEVLNNLNAATDVSVRDAHTQAVLKASGVNARLVPDCAVMVADLFGDVVRAHAAQGEPKQIIDTAPLGYLAVQFSADFGDYATLDAIAAQLDRIASVRKLAIVLFRAGAAPWHDDLACLQRTAARMRTRPVRVFESLNIWDICALIAHSRAYLGTSLHGRIVAMAFARPRINLLHDDAFARPVKQTAFATTWEEPGVPIAVKVRDMADGLNNALSVDQTQLQRTAARLVALYREGFTPLHVQLAAR